MLRFQIRYSLFLIVFSIGLSLPTSAQENASLQDFSGNVYPYKETFIISAYYSPLPDQSQYVTGTYEGDIRLNGSGVNSADNTPVYTGMIAAPSTYPFGTKMEIPGFGIGTVHDRGGAIKSKDESGELHDRLDLWMGYGDEGLRRALTWGKRSLEITVYGVDPTIEEAFYLENFAADTTVVPSPSVLPKSEPDSAFPLNFGRDAEGNNVEALQNALLSLNYLTKDDVTGYYGDRTIEAVYQFQLDQGIVFNESDLGAGYFGPKTREVMGQVSSNTYAADEPFYSYDDLREDLISFDDPLKLGDSGDAVRTLQDELRKLGYFRIEPTGYFGEVTEHAVFKLQQAWGLVEDVNTPGAGTVGPQTRAKLNEVLEKRMGSKRFIALKRNGLENQRFIALQSVGSVPSEFSGYVSIPNVETDSAPAETIEEDSIHGEAPSVSEEESTQSSIFATDLGYGDRGDHVETLQKVLKSLGHFKGLTSKYYGSSTQQAVKELQLQYNIIENSSEAGAGMVGPKTRKLLDELTADNTIA